MKCGCVESERKPGGTDERDEPLLFTYIYIYIYIYMFNLCLHESFNVTCSLLCRYTSSSQFLADLQQIADNARAYNTPGRGKLGSVQLILLAENMVSLAKDEIARSWEEIEAADEAIHEEMQNGAAAGLGTATGAQVQGITVTQVLWLQCESCSKWRVVPKEMNDEFAGTERQWYCRMLPDITCDTPEAEAT